MKRLELAHIPSDYRKEKDILTALAWNAVKKTLEEKKREGIFPYIESVKITDTYVTLSTKKPIILEELTLLRGDLEQSIKLSFAPFSKKERKIKIN